MAQRATAHSGEPTGGAPSGHTQAAHPRLGPFLCWAVVFADIGTSIYYVPGILYQQPGVGRLAGFFVLLTFVVFLLLTLKYAEVSARFPEGGGVVTVATRGINPWAGAVGGMFILVDYFLTAAISSLSGLLYFQAIVPRVAPFVLPGTLLVLVGLGVLNWWGIKESAVVSAVIASLAFLSDVVILLLIFVHVPLAVIGQIFAEMFHGQHLSGLTLLSGFAGAFLAFSGLESISQLSPVMRLPRKKTVAIALAFVVITVGISSPLLTTFSTVLLNDPRYAHFMRSPSYGAHADPNQFISLLAGAFGGRALEVATAVTASGLLIFASNTAIIGTYHVLLALSRMKFFPAVVERPSPWRGTPWVSIILATGIPILILIVVRGDVTTLGDLYAFGLLGAFSLTCISMDIIRTRERRGAPHVGADIDPEFLVPGYSAALPSQPAHAPILVRLYDAAFPPATREQVSALAARAAARLKPLGGALADPMASFTYYIGFLTTILVIVAWVTNLFFKTDAAKFGGGITLLGVAVSVAHYQYLHRRGEPVVFPDLPALTPESWLVVLSPTSNQSKKVTQAAVQSAHGRPLAFLYLAPQPLLEEPPRLFEIRDRYGHDRDAQRALSYARKECMARQIPAKYLYAVGGAKQVFDIARKIRPDEIVAEEQTAKRITRAAPSEAGMAVSPTYVRYQHIDGVTIAHNVLHGLYTHAANPTASHPPSPAQGPAESSARRPSPDVPRRPRSPAESSPPAGETPSGGAPRQADIQPPAGDDTASSNGFDSPRGRPAPPRD